MFDDLHASLGTEKCLKDKNKIAKLRKRKLGIKAMLGVLRIKKGITYVR